ncbi:ATP-dependent nuclease [Methanolacinia paynteri]|uniref:ATP-dependent nuclease n=1 Tax=Methanolacinia paynteri TaxID=230356 RepID=UPI00064EB07D|nr:AAA family ATPase [Methanolacinia paynteri]
MYLKNVRIKNFRSVGEDGLELSFTTNLTTLLGENNVGKSSIFKAIYQILESRNLVWNPEEWFFEDKKRIIEIQLDCILDNDIISDFIEAMGLPITVNQYKSIFSNEITYCAFNKTGVIESYLKIGLFKIDKGQCWLGKIVNENTLRLKAPLYHSVNFQEFIVSVLSKNENSPSDYIEEYLDLYSQGKPTKSIHVHIIRSDLSNILIDILKNRFVFINEYREKPDKKLSNFLVTTTGKELSSMLFNLKNGRDTQEKYLRIQKNFEKLFPNLKLDVFRNIEKNEIELLFTKDDLKSTTSYVGAGVLESLLLIAHLEAYKDHIFLIDHPETHLHPHAQRRLNNIIERNEDNQILIITHSPYFTNFNKKSRVIRLSQENQQTVKYCSQDNYFSEKEFIKLEQFLDSTTKELFFARKVILVEGATEIGAIPIFTDDLNFNLDDNGVSLINVDGCNNFPIFSKLCEAFSIPYIMLADSDAQHVIDKIKKEFPDSRAIVLEDDFEGLLPDELKEDSKLNCGNSKPRMGKYIAQKMIENNIAIPKEIEKILDNL